MVSIKYQQNYDPKKKKKDKVLFWAVIQNKTLKSTMTYIKKQKTPKLLEQPLQSTDFYIQNRTCRSILKMLYLECLPTP